MNNKSFPIAIDIAAFPTFRRPFFDGFIIEANHVEGDNVEKVDDVHANEYGIYARYDVDRARKEGDKDTDPQYWLASTDTRSHAEMLIRLFNALV